MKTLKIMLMALALIAAPAAIYAQAPTEAPAATVTDLDQKYATGVDDVDGRNPADVVSLSHGRLTHLFQVAHLRVFDAELSHAVLPRLHILVERHAHESHALGAELLVELHDER